MKVNGQEWYARFLVVTTHKHEGERFVDYYETFEDFAAAKSKYAEMIHNDDKLYMAHICVPIEGTDYDSCPLFQADSMTVDEAAKAAGLTSYDCALPQSWVDACYNRGLDVRGHFVWCYDDSLMGYPHPITPEGIVMAGKLAAQI